MNTYHTADAFSPSLSLGRYRLDWQVTRAIRLPDYAGSMLRGAFGHALRSISCITREKECTACPLRQDCPYTTLFEPIPPEHHPLQDFSRIPAPYIIEPPEWGARVLHPGDTLTFHFTLNTLYDLFRNAVVKSFELSLETTGKLLRKALKLYSGSPRKVDKLVFKDLFRHASKHGLLDEATVERWFAYRRANRNTTAHDYGADFVNETLKTLSMKP